MEISFNELRNKEVVNLQNGARMGRMIDIIIDPDGKDVLGIVVPGVRKLFKSNEDIFIPWSDIHKIGNDVLLVSLDVNSVTNVVRTKDKHENSRQNSEDFIT